MNRAQRIRLMVAHAAAAKALRVALETESKFEVEVNETRSTWNIPGIAAYASVEHDSAIVSDPEAFMDYLEQNHPTEVVRREIREIRVPSWLAARMEEWAALGPVLPPEDALPDEPPGVRTADGTVIPGLKFRRGGAFRSLSVKPGNTAARQLAATARRYALGTACFQDLADATHGPVEPADEPAP